MGNKYFQMDGYLSLGVDGYSDTINIGAYKHVAIQCDVIADATLDGYLSTQFSNTDIEWCDGNTSIHVQETGSHLFEISDTAVGFARVKWNHDTGSGGLTMHVSRKK